MKFRFENCIAPIRTGRYGIGETAARGIMIFPYSAKPARNVVKVRPLKNLKDMVV